MPGKPVTDQQVRLYMSDRPLHSQRVAAARACKIWKHLTEVLTTLDGESGNT